MKTRHHEQRRLAWAAAFLMSCGAPHGEPPGTGEGEPEEWSPRYSLTAGRARSCAIDQGGAVWCWGGSVVPHEEPLTDRSAPAYMQRWGGFEDAIGVSNDYGKTCAVRRSGELWCDDLITQQLDPRRVEGLEDVVQVDAAIGKACALRANGEVWCGTDLELSWERVEGIEATRIAGGLGHMCALSPAGRAWCWGRGDEGQLGDGDFGGARGVPVEARADVRFVDISATYEDTCAIDDGGRVHCWGALNGSASPALVPGFEAVERVATSAGELCAILEGGAVRCWSGGPASYARGIDDAAWIDGSVGHMCVMRASGRVTCWGNNDQGQAGARTPLPNDDVVTLGLTDVTHVSSHGAKTCASTLAGELWCWGRVSGLGRAGSGRAERRGGLRRGRARVGVHLDGQPGPLLEGGPGRRDDARGRGGALGGHRGAVCLA